MKIYRVLVVFAFLGSTGCGDKDAAEYARQKVAQELSRIDSVVGFYSGDLVSSADQSPLGKISLDLRSSTRVTPAQEGPANVQQAVLKGTVTIETEGKSSIPFSDGYFNPDTGAFQLSMSVLRRNLERVELEISGIATPEGVSGRVQVAEFPDRAGVFKIKRSTPEVLEAMVLKDADAVLPDGPAPKIWTTSLVLAHEPTAVDLVLWPQHANDLERTIELFVPTQLRDVTLFIGGIQNYVDHTQFKNALWDFGTGNLHAEVAATATLDCIAIRLRSKQEGWKCSFFQNGVGHTGMIFEPKAAR